MSKTKTFAAYDAIIFSWGKPIVQVFPNLILMPYGCLEYIFLYHTLQSLFKNIVHVISC